MMKPTTKMVNGQSRIVNWKNSLVQHYGLLDKLFDGISINELIEHLNSVKDELGEDTKILISYGYDGFLDIDTYYPVVETEDEYKKRMSKNKAASEKAREKRKLEKKKKEEQQLRLYESLKKKFGDADESKTN